MRKQRQNIIFHQTLPLPIYLEMPITVQLFSPKSFSGESEQAAGRMKWVNVVMAGGQYIEGRGALASKYRISNSKQLTDLPSKTK